MEHYEDGLDQNGSELLPGEATGRELDAVVRPALVAATRLFLVAGVVLVLVDENGELAGAVGAGDLADTLEEAAGPLWSGPCLEVLASGSPVGTANLAREERWPHLARTPALARVRGLVCVPVEGAGGPAGMLVVVRRPDRLWEAREVESVVVYAGVLAGLLRAAVEAETRAHVIGQLEHALHHRVVIEQAKGILMEREKVGPAGAFDRLRKAARAERRRVSEVAAEVVAGRVLSPVNGNGASPRA
jgi:hypothetical protein